MTRKNDRTWTLLSALLVAAYFLWYTRGALTSYFTNDDVTNLYRAWSYPLASLIKANLLFFLNSPFYRPFASVWYRVIFYFAGFNPIPFHAVNLLILAANIWLTYCVVRRLTGSREIGSVAALLIAYVPACGPLYFDTGFVFDVLCYFFYFSALLLYIRCRQENRPLRAWELAVCAVLFVCALGSKEIGVTLPAFLFLYEALYVGIPWRGLGRWLFRDGLGVVIAGCLTVLFTAGRLLDRSQPALVSLGAYRPVFTWDQLMQTSTNFFGDLFMLGHPASRAAVLVVWVVLFAVAWAAGSRTLKFAWLFLMLSPIPVAFIPPRGAPQYYVAIFGWVLYAAVVFARSAQFLLDRLPRGFRLHPAEARGPVMVAACALLLFPLYGKTGWTTVASVSLDGELLRQMNGQMHDLRPQLKPSARVLFLDDPVDDDYRLLFLMRESYGDVTLLVDRAKKMAVPPGPAEIAKADYVFDYRRGRFYTSQQAPEEIEPAIEYEWGRPAVFHHDDFHRITRWSPAKPGETVIARVMDLGATNPAMPAGQPFPQDPLMDVVAPVAVRVGGELSKVSLKVGWPHTIDSYRVDFPVPAGAHGDVPIQLIVGGVAGPEVSIPVE